MSTRNNNYQPVFLIGTTRSGTTLLSLILDHHPEINFVGEFEWIYDYNDGVQGEVVLEQYYEWLKTERIFNFHNLQINDYNNFPELVKDFFEQMNDAKKNDNNIIGVQLHRHYHKVLEVWPNAKFIHIVRDGRDVCASWIKFGWEGNGWISGQKWKQLIRSWVDLKKQLPTESYVEIKFEDLVSNVTEELGRIAEFLGVPYDDKMLTYSDNSTYDPINSKHMGKWKQKLSKKDIQLFEAEASEELSYFGYELLYDGSVNAHSRPKWWLSLDDKIKRNLVRLRFLGLGLFVKDHLSRRLKIKSWRDKIQLAINEKTNASLQ